MDLTPVIFRVWRDTGDVFALFPADSEKPGECSSYQHVGQHGSADYGHCIRQSRPAKPSEYRTLLRELQAQPYFYTLLVFRRWGALGPKVGILTTRGYRKSRANPKELSPCPA